MDPLSDTFSAVLQGWAVGSAAALALSMAVKPLWETGISSFSICPHHCFWKRKIEEVLGIERGEVCGCPWPLIQSPCL